MIAIEDGKEGALFGVKVTPRSSRDLVRGVEGSVLKVSVSAAPEKGKANDAAVELLADWLDISHARVRIVSGTTSRQKRVCISGMKAAELAVRIAARMREA
ncbi:MAG: DUF167 domain-containing protein [Planctomycetota bacterium]